MTFGYGSPGFNPFWCPPCPDGNLCNTMCFDPIDGTIVVFGVFILLAALRVYGVRTTEEHDDG